MKWINRILVTIILLVIVYAIYNRFAPDYMVESEKTEVVMDTTTVDSLQSVIDSYRDISSSRIDTVRDTIYVEKPVYINDSTARYTNMYSDSTLNATITSEVSAKPRQGKYTGVLENQVFTYSIKRERLRTVTNTVTLEKTKTIKETKTVVKKPKPYFTVGAQVGTHTFGPVVGFAKPDQYHLFYKYDMDNQGHSIGVSIPIKF